MVVLVIRNDLLLGIIYAISGICLRSYRIVVVVKSFTNCLCRDFCKCDSLPGVYSNHYVVLGKILFAASGSFDSVLLPNTLESR